MQFVEVLFENHWKKLENIPPNSQEMPEKNSGCRSTRVLNYQIDIALVIQNRRGVGHASCNVGLGCCQLVVLVRDDYHADRHRSACVSTSDPALQQADEP